MAIKKIIDVCVATYRRPEPLSALLASLLAQKLGGLRVRLIVVDNDPKASARARVMAFKRKSKWRVVYDVEPTPGISYVRNRALSHVRAPYFAFLDDDETANPDWLGSLWKALEDHRADVVFGRVKIQLPPDAPGWAKDFYLFHPPPVKTGSGVRTGPTSSVLVRTQALGNPPERFDPAFALTGGSDTDFFFRLHLAGRKLVRCEESVVMDPWPEGRLTVGWICRRRFRAGQTFTRVFVRRYSGIRRVIWFFKTLGQAGVGVLLLPLAVVVSGSKAVELLTRLCHVAGKLSALLGRGALYREYQARRSDARKL